MDMDDIRDDAAATFPVDGVRLDAVVAGRIPAADLTAEEAHLASIIAAITGPATGKELAGLSPALAAFAQHNAAVTASDTVTSAPRTHRHLGRRATAAIAASALVLLASGTAAAAYTGSLPEPLQRLAHAALNAPAPTAPTPEPVDRVALGAAGPSATTLQSPRPTPAPATLDTPTPAASVSASATGANPTPDPTASPLPTPSAGSTGNSAVGLCRAWTRMGSHANPNSAVVRSLIPLAGSRSQIPAYCAAIDVVVTPAPGSSGDKGGGGNGHVKGAGGHGTITSPKPSPTPLPKPSPTPHPIRHPRSPVPPTPAHQATTGPLAPAPSHGRHNPQPHHESS